MDPEMESSNKQKVGLRRCPRCHTSISSFIGRYGNVIRQTYLDIKAVQDRYCTENNFYKEVCNMQDKLATFKSDWGRFFAQSFV
jgi:hypothetical protein